MYNNIIRFLTVTAVFFLMGCGSAQTYLTGQLERQAGGFSEPGGPDTEPSGAETVTDMETGGMDTEAETPVVYYVHISGAVAHPGVYALPEGSRLFEAVQEAGGFTRTAAEAYCNLAAKLQDGMQYYIPTLEEAEQMPETAGSGASGQGSVYTADGKLDLNLAGKEDLLK
ncbi:MAG: SLBB domain-containing protein, partial [Lachnospiraceae bacterium]|nr:SLBB domain-containing protein [Lachnospiraceae bacterium]